MKARRKDNGQWVDVHYHGSSCGGFVRFFKEYNSDVKYTEEELIFEKEEKISSYWFNFRNQAAISAMQGMLANNGLILEDGDTYACLAVRYADALIEELNKKR